MDRIVFLMTCFCVAIAASYSNEIDYSNCESIQDVIVRETREIADTNPADHEELAQLYVSRGESYLLDAQYEKAVEDFRNANSHLGHSRNIDSAMIVAFRAAFGEVVSYDNLGMQEHTQQAIQQLQAIASCIGCNDCIEHRPCHGMITPATNKLHFRDMVRPHICDMIITCKSKKDKHENQQQQNQDNYDDILGPNQPPGANWCEEIVTGVGRAMDAIACLAPNYTVKVALIGIIEALITRGLKCCQAGGFWKACVAPITRKWAEWKNNKEKHILPNARNLPLYVN